MLDRHLSHDHKIQNAVALDIFVHGSTLEGSEDTLRTINTTFHIRHDRMHRIVLWASHEYPGHLRYERVYAGQWKHKVWTMHWLRSPLSPSFRQGIGGKLC